MRNAVSVVLTARLSGEQSRELPIEVDKVLSVFAALKLVL